MTDDDPEARHERTRAELVDAMRKNRELKRSLLVAQSLVSNLHAELEPLRARLHELERFATSTSASPATRGFAAFLGSLQRELNTGGLGAAPLEALRRTYARIRRAVSDPELADRKLLPPSPSSFPFLVDWPDGPTRVVPLYFCANHDGERITDTGAAAVEQKDRAASYLTHLPANMSRRPASSPTIPESEVELALSVSAAGVDVSVWIIEFHGERQVAKTSWRAHQDTTVHWKPHPQCDSIRFGVRLQGAGTLDSARVELRERGHEAKETERLMALWRALNAPRSELGSVAAAPPACPTYLGAEPEVIARAAVDTHPVFQSWGLSASKILLDGGALDGEIDRGVWPYLQAAITERAYRWTCPFTGASLRSTETFIASEPTAFAYVFVRFESAGHVFFLILCPFRSSRVGIYFPAEEIVVSRLKLGKLVRAFRSLVVRHADQFTRYLTTTEPRKTTVPINTLGHWGHVVLNEIEALQWMFETGNDTHIDLWLKGDVAFFEFDVLFPEIPRDRLRAALSPDERFRCCLRENALLIHPQIASYYLGAQAGSRLVDVWRREGERTGSTATVESKLAGHFPVIWCEIRANDRLWRNQLEGLKAVVAKLERLYPNMALVLAGWSRMLTPSVGDEKMIALDTKVINGITEALAPITCIPVVGVPTAEKLAWVLRCDFNISLMGSGFLFPLLAQLPGVLLVSRYYQENELFLGDEKRRVHFMYGDDRLAVLPAKFVIDDTSIVNGEVRDFSVDTFALADFVVTELGKVNKAVNR